MISWKAIGRSVAGTSHTATGKPCEDAIQYKVHRDAGGSEIMICCAADGAGSALYGGWAADFATRKITAALAALADEDRRLTEADIYQIAEDVYAELADEAVSKEVALNEYSCTLLGVYAAPDYAVFFQVGDGAIIRSDEYDIYHTLWWPFNGEYQNTTTFLIDQHNFSNLNITILEQQITEVGLFTDGLQLLTLNTELQKPHQPFFQPLYRHLRMADTPEKLALLNDKLAEYLQSSTINNRTDDDKTLFLATRAGGL